MSTLAMCIIRDLLLPAGSIKYLEAKITPLTLPQDCLAFGCSTDVSDRIHIPSVSKVCQDLKYTILKIKNY